MSKNILNSVINKNQLWISWEKLNHLGNGNIELNNITLSGPVLLDCSPMEKSGFLYFDLTEHFTVIIPEPYIIKFSWSDLLNQSTDKINIKRANIEDRNLGFLKLLTNKDKILLDCKDHHTDAEARGVYKASFRAMVYNSDGIPYNI